MSQFRPQPTDVEKVMRENDFIVSKTDPKGILKYGNQIFIEFSGYTEQELIGTNHNIVRHPDMPRGVFELLWRTVKTQTEMLAYVKNLCRDGSYYWVLATITPSIDYQGAIIGYYSVRRKPRNYALETIEPIYASMREIEQRYDKRKEGIAASVNYLTEFLESKNTTYEKFVLALDN
jgi:PAS domain S-box-containing protein